MAQPGLFILTVHRGIAQGTYYGSGGDGVCKGSGHPGLPQVAMNAAQFEDGETCGACIEVNASAPDLK